MIDCKKSFSMVCPIWLPFICYFSIEIAGNTYNTSNQKNMDDNYKKNKFLSTSMFASANS